MTYSALRDAMPALWQQCADDLVEVAREAEQAADDIYRRGKGALETHWTDAVGQRAAAKLERLGRAYEITAITLRGIASVLDGLSEGAAVTQQSLRGAVDLAASMGFQVDDAGALAILHPYLNPGDPDPLAGPGAQQVEGAIHDALTRAVVIDLDAAAELMRLVNAVTTDSIDRAQDVIQAQAAQDQVQLIRESLPVGRTPDEVAAWWSSLTPEQRDALEKAVPVDLYDLPGIPPDVKERLRGSYGYDRVELVRWAQEHWDDATIDIFENNCANFVSTALERAGLRKNLNPNPWIGTLNPRDAELVMLMPDRRDDEGWGHGAQWGWKWNDEHDFSHTPTWAESNPQRNFFLKHGGHEVPLSDARPGDIIYFEQQGTGGPTPESPGTVHHAAIVTSVTPDGDIHYTQHSDPRLNVSLNGRLAHEDVKEGDQRIVVVRVDPDWYDTDTIGRRIPGR